jgi:SAM-dependent methyltransferase
MVDKAKNYLSFEENKRILLSIADVIQIPYKNQLFDAVFIFGVLHHIPHWRGALTEISRVLKPSGMFIFEELYPSLYQNFITKHILLHPKKDRFYSDDLKNALCEAGLPLKTAWEIKSLGIVGDLPPKHVPDFKLELCHFLFLNANMPLALGDGNSMNYVV